MKKEKLVLIDGNSIAFRAFYALPLLSHTSGIHTNAVYGFAMMLLKIIEEEKPTHLLVAFDAGKSTFRHQIYPDYKGTREKTPHELSEQIPLIHELLDAFPIRHFEMEDIEADDIIGTLARQAENQKMKTVIISGDKDLLQLVTDHVELLLPKKGVTEAERYNPDVIFQRYGLTPSQIIDLKGLMGDASDHIPGIPGVGEKTAIKLLKQFPTVEEVLEHVDELPGKKLKERVATNRDQALLSKQLATIKCDVPMNFSLQDCVYQGMNQMQVAEVFRRLEFKTLLERIQMEESAESTYEKMEFQILDRDLQKKFETILQKDRLAFFVEATDQNPHRAEIIGFAISDGTQNLYIPMEVAVDWQAFHQWLGDSELRKIVYDSKSIQVLLARQSWPVNGLDFDLHLAGYLLDPSESKLRLSDLVTRYIPSHPLPSDDEVYGKGAKRKQLEGEALAEHLARKTTAILKLQPRLEEELKDKQLKELYDEVERPLADVLSGMEIAGVMVDRDCLDQLGNEIKQKMEHLEHEIYQLAETEFNINSPKQLAEVLFDRLGLPVIKKTKTGYSTSADVLEKLAPQHEVVEKILDFRQVGKLYSTYIEGLKKEIGPDEKIHTQFQQTVTATGRLSSTDPNLQNIPIRMEEGRKIRKVFIPSKESRYLLSADYSQIELRILAHLSGDDALKQAFIEDRDIHTHTAMDLFEVSENKVTSLMRRQAKAVNFGIVYGISDFGLAQNLNIPRKEAKQIIDRYFRSYPKVKSYLDSLIEEARNTGYVTTLLGRRRYLPDIKSRNFNRRSFAERTAMNTPIQGTAADMIKKAMVILQKQIQQKSFASQLLLQVHDELILEVPFEELTQMKYLVKESMESAVKLSIPLKIDINIGGNWYQAK